MGLNLGMNKKEKMMKGKLQLEADMMQDRLKKVKGLPVR